MLLPRGMFSFLAGRARRAGLAAFAAAALLGADGLAQVDPDELARRHFESGAAYFEQAEYEGALKEFEKAYELSKRHQILRNISIVQERLGNLAGAVAALDEFLEHAPDDPAASTMRARRDNLRKRLEQQQAEDAKKEAKRADEPEEPRSKEAEPTRTRPVEEGRSGGLPPEETMLLEDEPNLVPAYVLLSVGGLAGAGALLTGVFAKLEHDELTTNCKPSCTDNEIATGESLALTSTILTGVSVVTLGAGLIWWATADSGNESVARKPASTTALPDVNLQVSPTAGFAEAKWSF